MKPFNLEEAKAGKPVYTRDGHPVRIVCFDRQDDDFPIVGLIDNHNGEIVEAFTKSGKYRANDDKCPWDLMMADDEPKESEELVKYIPIYEDSTNGELAYAGIYSTLEKAESFGKKVPNDGTSKYIGVGEAKIKLIKEKQHHEGYVNLYRIDNKIFPGDPIYNTKEQGEADGKPVPAYITTIKIEWEE